MSEEQSAQLRRRRVRRAGRRRLRRPDRPVAPARSSPPRRSPAPPTSTGRCRPRPTAFETLAGHHAGRAAAGAAEVRRRGRGAGRRTGRRRVRRTPASRARLTAERGAAAGHRPDPLLRRRRAGARGPVGRGVPGRAHLATCGASRSASCAQVTPWNYPLMMAVWKIAPALAAGNTVVLKPSDTTPVTTLLLAEIAAEFLPPGVFNVVCGDRDTGRALVGAPDAARWCRSPARPGPAWRSPPRPRPTSSAPTWSSAARRRSSSSTTPTWRRRPRRSRSPATSTPGRTAPPRPGCWPAPGRPRRLRRPR